jgi:hypothetical protein
MPSNDSPTLDAAFRTTAKQAHALWRTRLRDAIQCRGGDLDHDTVAADDRCELGRILQQFGSDRAELQELREEHARFHQHAARILQMARDGRTAAATRSLEGEYELISGNLQMLIDRIGAAH